jgi:hypothetical protein
MSSHRLQVLVAPAFELRIRKAAERRRLSKGEWVRREKALAEPETHSDPLARLERLHAPTADIRRMLAQVEGGRR